MPRQIDTLFAWVTTSPMNGDEGVPSYPMPGSMHVSPLVGTELVRMEAMRPMAQRVAARMGRPVQLRMFASQGEVLEEVLPPNTPPPGE